MRGHQTDTSGLQFKQGDGLKLAIPGYTTDKVILFSTGGKFYTLEVAKLPGGRGHGEPVRIMVDMEKDQDVVTAFIHDPERRMLVASTAGNGFIVNEADVVANTRKGKQVLNVGGKDEAKVCVLAKGDHVAVVGKNRKMLIFPLEQLPEMGRGKGVRLQRYKDGEIADARVFSAEEGLSWSDSAGRVHTRTLAELADWLGERAQAGRMAPQGFPRTLSFGATGL
jgi:topoisomerase-4 subunit A